MRDERLLADGLVERIGESAGAITHRRYRVGKTPEKTIRDAAIYDHGVGMELAVALLTAEDTGVVASSQDIAAIGHRVVHGGELFRESLAVNGATVGTLRHRLKEKAAVRRIHGKTGTITSRGVSALSGYARLRKGETVAFCILINDFPSQNYYSAKLIENSICRAILGVPEPTRKKRRKK